MTLYIVLGMIAAVAVSSIALGYSFGYRRAVKVCVINFPMIQEAVDRAQKERGTKK